MNGYRLFPKLIGVSMPFLFYSKWDVLMNNLNGPRPLILSYCLPCLNKYYGWAPKTLEALLINGDIIYIQAISIDRTPIKPTFIVKPSASKSGIIINFIGKVLKVSKSSASKPPSVVKAYSQKPSSSDIVSIFTFCAFKPPCAFTNSCLLWQVNSLILKKNKVKKQRKNGILMTLKTRDILGLGKHFEDPLVIPKKDTTVGGIGSDKRSKSWTKICKCLFKKDYDDILKIFIYFEILLSYII